MKIKTKPGKQTVRALGMLLIIGILFALTAFSVNAKETLIPGGECIGVEIETPGVLVIGISKVLYARPAEKAGIFPGDLIVKANGADVGSAADFVRFVEENGEKPIELTVLREEKTLDVTVTPEKSESGVYRIGVFVRDSAAGIGTVTFTDPESRRFAALGHGVFEPETGLLVPFGSGEIKDICLDGVRKSKSGAPGELNGWLGREVLGTVEKNTKSGVFGTLNEIPDGIAPVGTADFSELHTGKAAIVCTTPKGKAEYEVTVTEVFGDDRPCKNFIIEVTDPVLLAETGGIVQGMSGSPVLQDGKLVGALTHVLVKEPSKGYCIYIGNMLKMMK